MNNNSIDIILRKNIKSLRIKLGWSQEFLAEKTGVSAPYITQIELGKRSPSLEIIEKLSKALGVEYKVLFENSEDDNAFLKESFSLRILEAKLISAISETVHKEMSDELKKDDLND